VSGVASPKNLWINSFSVIADTQPELPRVIPHFQFNVSRLRVLECVADGLGCYVVKLIGDD
jgi:hypothetical protein